ncbi:cold-regulated 413 inner membrane protein 1, chloroplastic-like isoform X1 [Senna tora]|uniref:Cold-regulated 413 inner membrane protein 1, chloroplastic-like isoform X1 n=1 Tax=Senna tora TaxID=362788 RepID=A0A834W2A9_9FABA|nr:cold-regulated 413 inner membrane protein 1, chloroplastic-like isoform X1 [Senna tora]
MSTISLTSAAQTSSCLFSNSNKNQCLRLHALALPPSPSPSRSSFSGTSLSHSYNPLRSLIGCNGSIAKSRRSRGFSAVCYAAPLTARNLQWITTISSVVLILARGTALQKTFLVPLFALQAPANIIAWMKGSYGLWSAFLALLVRLFFYIPGELELPFVALLLVIVAPYEVMKLRGTQEGAIISLLIAGYLAFQHFSRGSLQKAFDQSSIVASLAVICITVASLLLLI